MDRHSPKPRGLGEQYAAQFKDPTVAAAYTYRPGYPESLFPLLADLVVGHPRIVLDVGCGSGNVARLLASYVDHIDGVDVSEPLLELAHSLPNGDVPNVRWIHGSAEEVDLEPPYGLVTAGASLHWMEWSVVLPRFRRLLQSGGYLALVGTTSMGQAPWRSELLPLIQRWSTNRDFKPYDTVKELTARGLFRKVGETRTNFISFSQPVPDYVESFHARNGFSRDRMTPEAAATFDAAAAEILERHAVDGLLHWRYQGTLVWGEPDPSGS